MIVTVLQHKTHTNDQTIVTELKDLKLLKTKHSKEDAPLWNFTKTPNRKESPHSISGMIIDYDDYSLPEMNETYRFYTHKTHNGKYRIIIPFDREYDYPGAAAYQDEYMHMLKHMIKIDIPLLFERNILQKGCCTASRWFFMRPLTNELETHGSNIFYRPSFKIQSVPETKRFMHKIASPRNYECETEKVKTGILLRVYNFYTYYSELIDWSILDTKGKCVFDWHDEGRCGSLFNNPASNNKAFISCKHATCYEKLATYSHSYQNQDEKKGPLRIACPTVLYVAAAVIKGIWALEWVEMTAFTPYPYLLSRIERLQRLRFKAKIDAPTWVKTYHVNAIIHPESLQMYDYEDNVYVAKSKEKLIHEYEYTLGTYYGYRTCTHSKHLKSSTFVDEITRYSQAYMLNNYKSVQQLEHLNLQNGLLIFNIQAGSYYFQAHDRAIFSKVKLDYGYDEKAKCPLWIKTLTDYFDDPHSPQVEMLQEFFGYCLTYDRSLEKILFLFGASRGGKGTITNTLQYVVGGGDISMDYLLMPERRSTLCQNKKMVFVDEVPNFTSSNVINELKRISSTGGMEMRILCQQPYITHEVPKLVFAFNQLPAKFEIDKALKNRMVSLKFVHSFYGKEDIDLKDKLIKEASGILNWALKGYKRLYKRRRFYDYKAATLELYHEANAEIRELQVFLKEKKDKQYLWKTAELLDHYQQATGDFKISQQKFYSYLKELNVKRKVKSGVYYYNLSNI